MPPRNWCYDCHAYGENADFIILCDRHAAVQELYEAAKLASDWLKVDSNGTNAAYLQTQLTIALRLANGVLNTL